MAVFKPGILDVEDNVLSSKKCYHLKESNRISTCSQFCISEFSVIWVFVSHIFFFFPPTAFLYKHASQGKNLAKRCDKDGPELTLKRRTPSSRPFRERYNFDYVDSAFHFPLDLFSEKWGSESCVTFALLIAPCRVCPVLDVSEPMRWCRSDRWPRYKVWPGRNGRRTGRFHSDRTGQVSGV